MLGQFNRDLLLLCLLLITVAHAAAPVPTPLVTRALNLQAHYQNGVQAGRVIELTTNQERFISLWREQETSAPQGAVLLLHDAGHTPDWPFLLKQTRQFLPAIGWSTLAIDLPTPPQDAIGHLPLNGQAQAPLGTSLDADERIMARIAAGVQHLNREGYFNVALVGYGDGAYWSTRYLAERLTEDEEESYALILIDASQTPKLADLLGSLSVPTLDLMMQSSNLALLRARQRKAAAMRNGHPDYLQIRDAARQHSYGNPSIDRTTRRVWGWLRNHAAGTEAEVTEL